MIFSNIRSTTIRMRGGGSVTKEDEQISVALLSSSTTMKMIDAIRGAFFGLCTGDALGLPVQFQSREWMKENPIDRMIGYGTFNKPPGTWSDDSSLTFCLAESLCSGFNLQDIGRTFVAWMDEGYYSAEDRAFDIGNTTLRSISRLREGISPKESGDREDDCNGNGSLMRILPLAFFLEEDERDILFSVVHQVSAITHAHVVAKMACGIYIVFAICLKKGYTLKEAYRETEEICLKYYSHMPYREELSRFSRVLEGEIASLQKREIESSGYVVHTLEAALWCLLRNTSYSSTVLDAVNLGEDTDTTAAVAGGLAGLYYGYEEIPREWIHSLAGQDQISSLVERFAHSLEETDRRQDLD